VTAALFQFCPSSPSSSSATRCAREPPATTAPASPPPSAAREEGRRTVRVRAASARVACVSGTLSIRATGPAEIRLDPAQ
jgi:hypothetical protein